MDKQKRLCEIYVSSFILAVSAYLLRIAYTSKIRSNVTGMNAMIFPKIILYLIIILCLYLIVNSIFKLAQEKAHSEEYESTVNFKETPFISKKNNLLNSSNIALCNCVAKYWIYFKLHYFCVF